MAMRKTINFSTDVHYNFDSDDYDPNVEISYLCVDWDGERAKVSIPGGAIALLDAAELRALAEAATQIAEEYERGGIR